MNYHDYYKFRVSYITNKENNLIFLFVTSLTDKFENIKKELEKCQDEFLNLFEDILQHRFDAKTFEVFDPTIDSIHRNLRPKISLVGFSGVGKTTITKLIKADEIPMQHIPTITGDIATIKIGKLHFHLWDFAGQEQFSYLWNNFIKGSDAVLLITDSTLENIEKSKYFLELINEQAPNAQSAVIGNKQDLNGALNPVQIENILGLKAYSMIALEPKNRDKMIQIIADILEMSAEVSPLLKPLLERDKLTEEAVKALKDADFNKAAFLFDKISDLCIELGDDSLGREFFNKSQKIKDMLEKVGAPQPTPAAAIEPEMGTIPITDKKPVEIERQISKESELSPIPQLKTEEKSVEQQIFRKPSDIVATSKKEETLKVETQEEKEIKTPMGTKIKPEGISLKLNPEDFMVKTRPKSVTFVPKDASTKLKMASDRPAKDVEEPIAPKPVSPLKLMDEKEKLKPPPPKTPMISKIAPEPKIQPTPIASKPPLEPKIEPTPIFAKTTLKPKIQTTPPLPKVTLEPKLESVPPITKEAKTESTLLEEKQKEDIKKSIIELKLKKADISKMLLDLDMKELTGEITSEELEEKKKKIDVYLNKIAQEIQELESLLKD
ncbi:MAG: ADP-ribosylation factor-like protein [Promethearchaeota archaeon]